MSNYGRYFSPRDFNLVHSFNSELFNDLIQSICTLYKLSPDETTTNVYGEASSERGKVYYSGKTIETLVEFSPSTTNYDEFGPDKKKLVNFRFVERFMQQSNLYPETGDIIFWDNQFFEVSNNVQEQYVGGQEGKQLSIICETFLVRLSGLNIVEDEIPTDEETISVVSDGSVGSDSESVGSVPDFSLITTGSVYPPPVPIKDSLVAFWPFISPPQQDSDPLLDVVGNYNLEQVGYIYTNESENAWFSIPTNISYYATDGGGYSMLPNHLKTVNGDVVGDGGTASKTYSGWLAPFFYNDLHEAIISEGISSTSSVGKSLTITINAGRICLVTQTVDGDQSAYYGTKKIFNVSGEPDWIFFTVVTSPSGYIDEATVYINGYEVSLDQTETNSHVIADVGNGRATTLFVRNINGDFDFEKDTETIFAHIMIANGSWTQTQHQWVYNNENGRTVSDIVNSSIV